MSATLKLITVERRWNDVVPETNIERLEREGRLKCLGKPIHFGFGTHSIFDSITCFGWSNLLVSKEELRKVRQKQSKGEEIKFGDTTWYFNGHCVVLNRQRRIRLSEMLKGLPRDAELQESPERDETADWAKVPPEPEQPVITFGISCPDDALSARCIREEWEEKVAARRAMIDEIVAKRKKPETIIRRIGKQDGTTEDHPVAKSHFRDLKMILTGIRTGIRAGLKQQQNKNIALYFA